MCTVTWVHQDGGYQVLCNRDEKRSRARALPPQVHLANGVRYLAPTDGNFGGTWIATNEFGLTICLLNGAGPAAAPRQFTSRGLLVLDLISAESTEQACDLACRADLQKFAPFTLAMVDPLGPEAILEWTGGAKTITARAENRLPLTSSSFDTDRVCATRRREFASRERADAASLYEFHATHLAGPGAYSPCMHRPDAATVSFSWINVTQTEVDFFYTPDAPCRRSPGEHQTLPRI